MKKLVPLIEIIPTPTGTSHFWELFNKRHDESRDIDRRDRSYHEEDLKNPGND